SESLAPYGPLFVAVTCPAYAMASPIVLILANASWRALRRGGVVGRAIAAICRATLFELGPRPQPAHAIARDRASGSTTKLSLRHNEAKISVCTVRPSSLNRSRVRRSTT